MTAASTAGSATAAPALLELSTGYIVTKALSVAAQLGVADLLADGPRPAAELAAATGADERSLYRVLRLLAAAGVLAQRSSGEFELTNVGAGLRSDVDGSLRAWVIMNSEGVYGAFRDVLHSVQTGEPAFERVFGAPLFEHLARHPEQGAVFNDAMGDFSRQATTAAAASLDLGGVERLVDVGGGDGTFVAAALARNPRMHATLYDLPHVAGLTRAKLDAAGLADRCEVVAGDFFRSVPRGGDAYVLSWILHDWDDERCVQILHNCREAIDDGGRLLVVETLIPEGDEPHWGKVLDVAMLVVTGGRERTEDEYAALFERSGFRLSEVHRIPSLMSVLEARPA
ncbi:MAG TPA: methyltransferase [Solirubrobacteraceae bacterium]